MCEGGGDTEDKRTFELQIITRNETISDQKSCSVCVCVCEGAGGTPRTNVHLICRLSREIKPYPIRKRADRRRKHNKHSHGAAQKHLDTIIAGEIIISIFYNLIDCNLYISPGLMFCFLVIFQDLCILLI